MGMLAHTSAAKKSARGPGASSSSFGPAFNFLSAVVKAVVGFVLLVFSCVTHFVLESFLYAVGILTVPLAPAFPLLSLTLMAVAFGAVVTAIERAVAVIGFH